MGQRHAISDEDWCRIEHLLPGRPGDPGWIGRDHRLFVDAVLYVAKTGIPWRDLPARFGNWNSAWRRACWTDSRLRSCRSAPAWAVRKPAWRQMRLASSPS